MTNRVYSSADMASLCVLLMRVAKNDNNEKYSSFEEQISDYLALANQHPSHDFCQNIKLIYDAWKDDAQIRALVGRAHVAIAELLETMVEKQRWHECAVLSREDILRLAGLLEEEA